MTNTVAPYHSDQVHRKEPKSWMYKVESNGHRHSERSAERSSCIPKRKRSPYKDNAIPVVPSTKGDVQKGDCKQWTPKGSCSRSTKCACKHDDQKRGKGIVSMTRKGVRTKAERASSVPSSISKMTNSPLRKKAPKGNKVQDSSAIAKQTKSRGERSVQSSLRYDYATCNLSSTLLVSVLNSGHFVWTTLNWSIMFF